MKNIFSLIHFLGIGELPTNCQQLIIIFCFINALYFFCAFFSVPFVFLHLIDFFGSFKAGFLLSLYLLVMTCFDFLTGALSDKIGQRNILIVANVFFAIFYYVFSLTIKFDTFILLMVLFGFGSAFQSGALRTWFVNQYKVLSEDLDQKRQLFGFFSARIRMIQWVFIALSAFLGSNIVYYFSLRAVFQLTSLFYCSLIIVLILLMKNSKLLVEFNSTKKNSYFKILFKSVHYLFTNKSLLVFTLGNIFWMVAFSTPFESLLLIPIQYGYSGNAQIYGIMQAGLFSIAFLSGISVSILTRRLKNTSIVFVSLTYILILHSGFILLLYFIPLHEQFNLMAIISIFLLTFMAESFFGEVGMNLAQRIAVDLIPSDFRNSITSVVSTLFSLLTIIMLSVVGYVIERYNMTSALVILELTGLIGSGLFAVYMILEKNNSKQLALLKQ